MKRTVSEISIDTQLIIARLSDTKEGDVVSYEELTTIVGRDVRSVAKGCTRTARKRLLKEQIYFKCIVNVGFKRCNDREKVHGGGAYIGKARRACRRGAQITMSVTDYNAMTREDQTQHNMQLSLFQTLRAISTVGKQAAIAEQVEQAQKTLSLAGTLKAVRDYEKAIEKPKRPEVNGVTE